MDLSEKQKVLLTAELFLLPQTYYLKYLSIFLLGKKIPPMPEVGKRFSLGRKIKGIKLVSTGARDGSQMGSALPNLTT